jgi:hypothetical protein
MDQMKKLNQDTKFYLHVFFSSRATSSRQFTSFIKLKRNWERFCPSEYKFLGLHNNCFRKRNVEASKLNLHEYLVRKYAFLYKIINMPRDGHCILIGEPENNAAEICGMLSVGFFENNNALLMF